MSPLKVGLEFHQRLAFHKLFCSCPSTSPGEASGKVLRRLRSSASELGELDPAALAEASRSRLFTYHVDDSFNCLVELDEEPPHLIDDEILDAALEMALYFNMTVVDEARVMRKTVIDGSNTSGFQRTLLVALGSDDSIVETSEGPVRLKSLCLEEESAFIVESGREAAEYRLDRLGIPLVEIATEPDIKSPSQALETAEEVGLALRMTGKVMRGLGTIRQDLNISVEGGARQEIKGVQNLKLIPEIVEREALRQNNLLRLRDLLRARCSPDSLTYDPVDLTSVFKETRSKLILKALSKGDVVYGLKAPGFKGLLGMELQPGRRFGTELADYARVWGGLQGIIHTDELPGYGISESEVIETCRALDLSGDDAGVIVVGEPARVEAALKAVYSRLLKAFDGVPSETRRALEDGNTDYLRPLPGSARMYPETDIPPIPVSRERLEKIRMMLPKRPREKIRELEAIGLNSHMAQQLVRSHYLFVFEKSIRASGLPPVAIASFLLNTLPYVRREGGREFSDEELITVLRTFPSDLPREMIQEALTLFADKNMSLGEVYEELRRRRVGEEDLRAEAKRLVEENISYVKEKGVDSVKLLMGRMMEKFRGVAEGSTIYRVLMEEVKRRLE
ncbi:MAG: Glu-tRNA(Gln) amidotransferase subunit GatE [Candidatus Brockarchaeota archaeon]|nr:Glu-tRNA(Gln) amidotransferase subunit GatE [Candidatus Brockarchaeota archaeon]